MIDYEIQRRSTTREIDVAFPPAGFDWTFPSHYAGKMTTYRIFVVTFVYTDDKPPAWRADAARVNKTTGDLGRSMEIKSSDEFNGSGDLVKRQLGILANTFDPRTIDEQLGTARRPTPWRDPASLLTDGPPSEPNSGRWFDFSLTEDERRIRLVQDPEWPDTDDPIRR